jgi:hypothetical protein
LFVKHDPNASITGCDVKFSDAMSSMPDLQRGKLWLLCWGCHQVHEWPPAHNTKARTQRVNWE